MESIDEQSKRYLWISCANNFPDLNCYSKSPLTDYISDMKTNFQYSD